MKKVYSANNLMEAQIVLDLLEHAYIPAQLFNQHAQSGMGEIPFTHAYPEVWVMRDEDYVPFIVLLAVKKIQLIFSYAGNAVPVWKLFYTQPTCPSNGYNPVALTSNAIAYFHSNYP